MAVDAILTLGDFAFKRYEIPEWVRFGGPFRAKVHTQPGGTRQIDSLGPDDKEIRWDGIMLTADGEDRTHTLWAMYEAGDKLPLHFGSWYFDVIISSLVIEYKANNYCRYEIGLTRVINAADIEGQPNAPLQENLAGAQNVVPPLPAPAPGAPVAPPAPPIITLV